MNTILALTGIACALGVLIFVVGKVLPQESNELRKTEELSSILPGMNCGACGFPGCFAYAQALAADPNTISKSPCSVTLQDPQRTEDLELALGVTLDSAALAKKASVQCSGNSSPAFVNSGVNSCKSAALKLGGFRTCPFACLGLGDCVNVCPQNAISITPHKNVAAIDWNDCIGCGLCVSECPQNVISLIPSDSKIAYLCSYSPLKNVPGRIRCDSGCTHCKKCFRACEDDAIVWNTDSLTPEFVPANCTLCLKCVNACPANCLSPLTLKENGDLSPS